VYNFWWLNVRERYHMEDIGVDGRIILRCIFTHLECRSVEWINLAHDRDSWRALVNALMNILVL
jgi:hypothetical protein